MEKIKLNNQIVLMRKFVKQAKVHIINKLVKRAKAFQNRKGNDVQVQKAQRKAQRFLEQIAVLKKIKPDDVSKLALSKAKYWKEVLQQKNATLHDRCVAMLATYAAVQKEVEIFHSFNKELIPKIADLIKQWEEKNKISKDSLKVKKLSDQKETNRKTKRMELKNENLITNVKNQSEFVDITSKSPSSGGKLKKNKTSEEQYKISVLEQLQNNISIDLPEEELCNEGKNLKLTKSVNELERNTVKVSDLDNRNFDEKTIEIKESDCNNTKLKNMVEREDSVENEDVGNKIEAEESNEDEEDKNKMEVEESHSENEEETNHDESEESENEIESRKPKGNNDEVLKQADVKELQKVNMKIDNKKNLKAIALLNLDELKGLDEIPINNTTENDESDKSEETHEDETSDVSQNKLNDPFFLGRGGESFSEDKLLDSSKNNNFVPKSKNTFFYDSNQSRKKFFFERKENSNSKYSYRKDLQKFSETNSKQFSRRDSENNWKNKECFQPFKKNKTLQNNYHDKFHQKGKNNFHEINFKNKKELNDKTYPQNDSYRKRKLGDSTSHLHSKNGRHDLPVKKKGPHKNDNVNPVKPLHPSWEARKKEKEFAKVSFQGKRMVFSD